MVDCCHELSKKKREENEHRNTYQNIAGVPHLPASNVQAKITTLRALVVLESTRVEEIVLGSLFVLREGLENRTK